MGATLRFLVPQATTNYVENPSVRYDLSGWTADGSTVTRTLAEARFGVASLQVVAPGTLNREGVFYRVNTFTNINDFIAGSVYVRGTGTVRLRLIDNPAGKEWLSSSVELRTDRWRRIEVLGRTTGSDDFRLYVETSEDVPQTVTFFVDGAQLEVGEEVTTYCDGDQPGCRWNIRQHDSLSTRNANVRAGGRWVEIAGPSCEKKNLYVTVVGGLGVAPIDSQFQTFADAPGGYYQQAKVQTRFITLNFHAKHEQRIRTSDLPSLRALHKLRQQLFDVVKPDLTAGAEPFTLEYCDGTIKLYLQVRYDGGMEGSWDIRNKFITSFPLRLICVSPFFVEDGQEVDELTFRNTQTLNYVLQRVNGEWSDMNGGFDDQIRGLEVGTRGEIIAVGDFELKQKMTKNNDPMIFANHIASWNGTLWSKFGAGANGIIRAISIAPNGDIYVGGDFTSIGGVAANRVAFWDGGTWNAMGPGVNASVHAIKVSSNGDVYVGGDFTTPTNYIAMWDGAWHDLGSNAGLNNSVFTIAITDDGNIVYLGGDFTDEQSDPGILELNYVALYDPAFTTFDELGTGFDATVRVLHVLSSGRLYAGGDFTESNDAALTLLYVAFWNGASWFEVGVGANNTVRDLDVSKLGTIVTGGDFTRIGSADSLYAGLWNESSFVNMDVVLDSPVFAVEIDNQDNLFLAPNGTGVQFASISTVKNIGSAETSPVIYIVGPCTLLWIENQTTQRRIYTDIDVVENEEVVIDFANGTVQSNVRGDLAYQIFPGSDFRAWTLAPGDNKISILMTQDKDASIHISYIPRHWSVDATAEPKSL